MNLRHHFNPTLPAFSSVKIRPNMFCFHRTSFTCVTDLSIKELASSRHSRTVYGWRMAARRRIMPTRIFSTRNIGELTPRPLANFDLFLLNLPLSILFVKSTSSTPYLSVTSLIMFGKVLRGSEAGGFVWDKYRDSRHSVAKFRALIKSCIFEMVAASVEPFFRPPKFKGCCTCAATLASCDDKDISASLLLPSVAHEDRPSHEGRVSSEGNTPPRRGVSPMRPIGGGE
jgi:hypothetical protein